MVDCATTLLVDANILVRFMTNDHPVHSPAAREFIRRADAGEIKLEVPFSVVAETVFTLGRFYQIPKRDISIRMLTLFTCPGIKLLAPSWTLQALEELGNSAISFGDACLAAVARLRDIPILTFDEDFTTIPGITRCNPLEFNDGAV